MFDVAAITPDKDVLSILGKIWIENGGTLRGAWDAFAVFPDGRIVFREVKRRSKDQLNDHQRLFAEAARRAFPEADLAVVEWTTTG